MGLLYLYYHLFGQGIPWFNARILHFPAVVFMVGHVFQVNYWKSLRVKGRERW
jgi:hypothetical protein